MKQEYRPGERLLSDYSGSTLSYKNEDGDEVKVEIFVSVLGFSNRIYSEATPSQKIFHWISSHVRTLDYFQGVPEAIYIDNLKSGVTRSDRYEPLVNLTFEEFAKHYSLTIFQVRAGQPRDKAKVEKAVQDVGRRILAPLRAVEFRTLAAINQAMKPLLAALNNRIMKDYGKSRNQLFEEQEKVYLNPLPLHRHIVSEWTRAIVHLDYHIQVDHHFY
jgi:transposase